MPIIADMTLRARRKQRAAAIARIPQEVKDFYGVTEDLLKTLFHNFVGHAVFPCDRDFEKDRYGHNLYPDLAKPLVIAYCRTEADVGYCLAVARKVASKNIPFTCRGGGHSNAGYSVVTGIVIDVSPMSTPYLAPDGSSVFIGAGATLGDLNSALAPYHLHVPGGECGSVGVAGHSMGGGYGFTSRMFGLNCDFVIGARVMLANGSVVRADATTNPDLFWAIRGGTGNNFGVLLSLQYRTARLDDVWAFVLTWPISAAAKVMPVLQDKYMRRGLTSDMGYQLAWGPYEGNKDDERLYMMGMYRGDPATGEALLDEVRKIGGGQIVKQTTGPYIKLNGYLLDWYQDPPLESTKEIKQTNFVDRTLSEAEWQKIVDYYLTKPNMYDMVAFEVYGGVATDPGVSNAFIHRDNDFDMFIDSFSNPEKFGTTPAQAAAWLEGFDAVMQPYSNGHKYQNYPNRVNVNYRWNYWGDAYPTLLAIKKKYDPGNFFNFQQAITDYPDGDGITRSDAKPEFPETPIEYDLPAGAYPGLDGG